MKPLIAWGPLKEERRLLGAGDLPLGHPVQVFNEYYLSKRNDEGILDRADLEPAEIVTLLPWIQFLEETGPEMFEHRLVGTGLVDLLGVDNTGKLFGHGINAEVKRVRIEEFHIALATCEPVFSHSSLMQEDRSFIKVIRGIFPGRKGDRRLIYMPLASEGKLLAG